VQKLLDSPGNVRSDDLISVLLSLGFHEKGGKGSHRCFKHPDLPHVKLTVPRQNPLRRAYVTKAIEAIAELLDAEDENE
jgi:predicted RNA binding protein YcfA (HicA-like mRNA interferase family)